MALKAPEGSAQAITKNLKVSSQKLNLVASMIRGKKVDKAINDLQFSRKRIAQDVLKTLKSAIANAENNHNLDIDELYVNEAYVGKNLVLKRWKPRARGRVGRIHKPFSQLTVVVKQLENEQSNISSEPAYPHQIYQNCLPQCDDFTNNGYTKEEMKLTNETKKILDANIDVVATAVRVPVVRGHSESVNITFENEFDLDEIRLILNKMDGVTVVDDLQKNEYPMPINCYKKNTVFVGRIRRDFTQEKTLNMWIVADNLRKGAATNTVQIAEYLIAKRLI